MKSEMGIRVEEEKEIIEGPLRDEDKQGQLL
jgi:hypothetical protein